MPRSAGRDPLAQKETLANPFFFVIVSKMMVWTSKDFKCQENGYEQNEFHGCNVIKMVWVRAIYSLEKVVIHRTNFLGSILISLTETQF